MCMCDTSGIHKRIVLWLEAAGGCSAERTDTGGCCSDDLRCGKFPYIGRPLINPHVDFVVYRGQSGASR